MKLSKEKIKTIVQENYGRVALSESGCCGENKISSIKELSKQLDYSQEDIACGLGDSNLGLGCGNPVAISDLKSGETLVDLGCGAGFDAFLAAKKVTLKGNVIGIDMTPEMISKAKKNAKKGDYKNVDFRLGEIDNLPISDNTADVVISNCVINLAPDKKSVYREIFRILKPGGRISISDMVRCGEIPEEIKNNPAAYTG